MIGVDRVRALLADERLLWFLMRGSGLVLLVVLTASVVAGVAAVVTPAPHTAAGLPRFALQRVHRDLSLTGLALLAVHVVTAVLHTYVDIRWINVVIPFVGPYEPLWIGLGTAALDLTIAATVVAALRGRLSGRTWRMIHLLSYGAWGLAVVHSIGIGTDIGTEIGKLWGATLVAACVIVVVAALAVRLVAARRLPRAEPALTPVRHRR